jgi:DNA polymerase (family 10)
LGPARFYPLAAASRTGDGVTATNPLTLGRAWDVVDRLVTSIAFACPDIRALEPAGDLRRGEPLATSVILVGSSVDPRGTLSTILSLFNPRDLIERTDDRLVVNYLNAAVDIRITTPVAFGTTMLQATGTPKHVEQLIALGAPLTNRFSSEAEIYASIGLPYVPPEIRDGTDEIEAARNGQLPKLVDVADVRGDLHMHTTYSDGRDSLRAMVQGCHALGYEYMAITDHSWGATASRTMAVTAAHEQRAEIEALRDEFAPMTILHGVEVDILPDGSLDFSDDLLETFDIVLASLHEHARHSGQQLTERTIAAIKHPFVNVICHPANQLVGRHPGYALDFDAIYRAAADTGTALEIDGAPSHMDLDASRARAAATAGVTLVLDSDCHRVEALGRQMRLGVGTARRAWLTSANILNTRPLAELREFIHAKRRGSR